MCVFSSYSVWTSSSLDVPAGATQEEGHAGFLIHLSSVVLAFIFIYREKDSTIPFPRRPSSRILCTHDLIVLHPLGIFSFRFLVV